MPDYVHNSTHTHSTYVPVVFETLLPFALSSSQHRSLPLPAAYEIAAGKRVGHIRMQVKKIGAFEAARG